MGNPLEQQSKNHSDRYSSEATDNDSRSHKLLMEVLKCSICTTAPSELKSTNTLEKGDVVPSLGIKLLLLELTMLRGIG